MANIEVASVTGYYFYWCHEESCSNDLFLTPLKKFISERTRTSAELLYGED